ncbi:glycosyl hydrolase, partial [[Kitasatospora] papulosa]
MRHPSLLARRRYGPARWWLALLGSFLMVLGLASTAAYGRDDDRSAAAADQVLNWTAGDPIDHYLTAPKTAVAGAATIVFENSTATGNTTGMPHTLTFSVSDP